MVTIASRAIGASGAMFIDDDGTSIRYYLSQSDPATFIGSPGKPFAITINGQNIDATFTWASGGGTRLIAGPYVANGSQTVAFAVGQTNTSGFGSGGTIAGAVNRTPAATVPGTPGQPVPSQVTPNSMRLTWTIPSNGGAAIDQMLLRRSLTSDFASYVDYPQAANATTAVVSGLTPGTTYYWRVFAHNAVGFSPNSPTRAQATSAPPAPGMSVVRTDTQATITLTPPSGTTGMTKYRVERRTAGSTFTSGQDTTTSPLVQSDLSATTRYEWRASAYFGTYQSPWTEWLSTPAAPSTPSASEIQPNSMRLTWVRPTDNGGSAITGMVLRYSTSSNFSSFTDVNLSASATTTVVSGLTPGTPYYWRVYARNAVGLGPASPTRTQAALPAGSPGLSVTASVSGISATATMSPPGGASGVTKYTLQRRLNGTTTPVTSTDTTSTTLSITGLTPGSTYQYRASAWYGTYQSPWTGWVTVAQPNPNTDPGTYFDGNTPNSSSVAYSWTGTQNLSTSVATSLAPTGWATFAECTGSSGGTGVVFRAAGGRYGSFSARALFFTDATAAGFAFGTGTTSDAYAEVGENVEYVGSLYVWPSKAQRLRALISWHTAGGTFIGSSYGSAELVNAGGWTRLDVSAASPVGARRARVRVQDVAGTGWSLWQGGDWIQADAAMLSVQTLYPYFDGNTKDTTQFVYEWEGATNASASLRRETVQAEVDPIADPDCPPIPGAPQPPVIADTCIDEVGTWRRYWAVIPEEEVYDWLSVVPTTRIMTAGSAARQVRIRYYQNPDDLSPENAGNLPAESEQIISYMPANTVVTLDGVSQSAWASVNGGDDVPAGHRLYGPDGGPATWPTLECGSAYLISFDVPLDAPEGNVNVAVDLTTRSL